jgi:hypothetical protein
MLYILNCDIITIGNTRITNAVTGVSFLVRQGVWGPPRSPLDPRLNPGNGPRGESPIKLRIYLKLQGYFGYANDRTQ